MTFNRDTRTFTVNTGSVGDINTYEISVKGYANDREFGEAIFKVYVVASDPPCATLTSTTLSGRNQNYRIGSGMKSFTFFPTLLSNSACYD